MFDVAMATTKFLVDLTKNQHFKGITEVLSSFVHQIAEIREFLNFSKSILA